MYPPKPSVDEVRALRRFNRFITRRIGVLEPYLGSELSLTEVRVLYELAHLATSPVARELARDLALDGGYLSRILQRFEAAGWLSRQPDARDARQSLLVLTPAGHAAFAPLQQRSREAAAELLATLPAAQRATLLQAMEHIETLLGPAAAAPAPLVVLRDARPGDIGWVVQQHGEIYAREYGWNQEFEALVAEIGARFIKRFQPEWEKCWIAERNGERLGSVFVARKTRTTAQLRMLLLTPQARGLGLGGRLVDECLAFARARGYRKMVLWTNANLTAARSIYTKRGFQLTASEPYEGFGQQLVGETWELKL